MSVPPIPVVFQPIFVPRPWGGRRIETGLGKRLPPGQRIGESWELAGIPEAHSRVRDGPLAGQGLLELVEMWGAGLLGSASLLDGRFPLFVKFIDARESPGMLIHRAGTADRVAGDPRSRGLTPAGQVVKAWFVLAGRDEAMEPPSDGGLCTGTPTAREGPIRAPTASERPAQAAQDADDSRIVAAPSVPALLIGWKRRHESRTAHAASNPPAPHAGACQSAPGNPQFANRDSQCLLQPRRAQPGRCYFIPAGVPHAIGPGVLVAEVRTPFDPVDDSTLTVGNAHPPEPGRSPLRTLPAREGPAETPPETGDSSAAAGVPDSLIEQPRSHVAGVFATLTREVVSDAFLIDRVRFIEGAWLGFPHAEMIVWVVLGGSGTLHRGDCTCHYARGDVVLIPADSAALRLEVESASDVLEIKLPIPSPHRGAARPPPEAMPRPAGPQPLTVGGRPLGRS